MIPADPFKLFKKKKIKITKEPLSERELFLIENQKFASPRLDTARDIFVFQCYTGLAYIDAFNLKKEHIKIGVDGNWWIINERHKSQTVSYIPLLPKATEIIEKYKNHPLCLRRGTLLPVISNQKMNAYLDEIGAISGVLSF